MHHNIEYCLHIPIASQRRPRVRVQSTYIHTYIHTFTQSQSASTCDASERAARLSLEIYNLQASVRWSPHKEHQTLSQHIYAYINKYEYMYLQPQIEALCFHSQASKQIPTHYLLIHTYIHTYIHTSRAKTGQGIKESTRPHALHLYFRPNGTA
jgi:hypothetical protein